MNKLSITVAALGPGDPSLLTLGSRRAFEEAAQVILRTDHHPAAAFLREMGVFYTTLDALYEKSFDFDELNRRAAQSLWIAAEKGPLCYGVPDPNEDETVRALLAAAPENGEVAVLPGVGLCQVCQSALPLRANRSTVLRALPAIACEGSPLIPGEPLMVTELNSPVLTSQVKLWLMTLYPHGMEVWFFPPCEKWPRPVLPIPLAELDRQKRYDHTACVFVPVSPYSQRDRFCFQDLADIMKRLRGPGGCSWDREQTHESLAPYLIEEAYETADAIEQKDPAHIADELGDVLLQVAFHADIAAQHGEFDMYDITSAICHKMIYRHPHIFGGGPEADGGNAGWELLKKNEKGLATHTASMEDVAKGLPALTRAWKVLGKAQQAGFAPESVKAALRQAQAALEALDKETGADQSAQAGRALLALIQLARLMNCQPEAALSQAVSEYIRQFSQMENAILSDGKALEDLTLSEMDVYWNMGKMQDERG